MRMRSIGPSGRPAKGNAVTLKSPTEPRPCYDIIELSSPASRACPACAL
jgi:hypothetical protein